MNKKTLIFIPTYNEKDNVWALFDKIIALGLESDILFMDDNSSDGTGEILDNISSKHPNMRVIHRPKKFGIGNAHLAGIKWAYEKKYSVLITMDCDFSHPPEYIPDMLNNAAGFDVVVGSRYIFEDSLNGWNLLRKALTIMGHFMTKYLLRMQYDATGAFRLYDLDKIPEYVFDLIKSGEYSFFFESLYILDQNKFSIKEIPIKLPPRTYGSSKMRIRDVGHSLTFLFHLCLVRLFNKEKFKISEPFKPKTLLGIPHNNVEEWDNYWGSKKSTGGLVYDLIAMLYRKFIIKRALNHFLKKYFKKGAKILHAGCGSGQVDSDIRNYIDITALDISERALTLYRKLNKNNCVLLCGSVFNIPLAEFSMDGIYNLGVMEHFTENGIKSILREFYRVLKPDGKIIIFWPPEYGLSVLFFKALKAILQFVFPKKNVKLHPVEITRIKSRGHAKTIFNESNFKVLDYYFGIRDLFTYSVIVAVK